MKWLDRLDDVSYRKVGFPCSAHMLFLVLLLSSSVVGSCCTSVVSLLIVCAIAVLLLLVLHDYSQHREESCRERQLHKDPRYLKVKEIEKLSGEQLDLAVAEYVFNEQKPVARDNHRNFNAFDYYGVRSPKRAWYASYDYWEGDTGEWHVVPFSSNLRLSGEVCDHMAKRTAVRFGSNIDDGQFAQFGDDFEVSSAEDSLPTVVCRAAVVWAIYHQEE